jgi:hypothetical protein
MAMFNILHGYVHPIAAAVAAVYKDSLTAQFRDFSNIFHSILSFILDIPKVSFVV